MAGCRSLSLNEISLVLAALNTPRDRALFVLGVRSGFRISELLSLKVGDVVQQGAIVSTVMVHRRNMKGKEQSRAVPLHADAKQAILDYIGLTTRPDFYLFKSRKLFNAPLSRIQAGRILKDAYRAAGIGGKVATHSMRKTFATQIHDKLGRDLLKTQRALGHANINNTVKYLTVDDAEIDAAILGL